MTALAPALRTAASSRTTAIVTLSAAGILMMTMGARQSMGLFVSPLNTATGLGIATISLALAIGQLMWGVSQPLAGAAAQRFGPDRVLVAGVVLLAAGIALAPFLPSAFGLVVTLGLLSAIGSGVGSFSVLIGVVAPRVPVEQRGNAAGVINAGGSAGQVVFAVIAQALIGVIGWAGALWSLALMTLAALPLIRVVTGGRPGHVAAPDAAHGAVRGASAPPAGSRTSAWTVVRAALRERSYLLLHAGFFTCGFHIAFLVTHLPTEIGLCGLPPAVAGWSMALIGLSNIAGSLVLGAGTQRYRSKHLLALTYGCRALLVAGFLVAPRTPWTFYLFAFGLGLTWLATVPPTATIVSKLFGVRDLSTLFGLTLVTHQVGGFLGAWLGGLALQHSGSYQWMWYADMALAVGAALVNLPIREARVTRVQPMPAPA